MDTSSPAPSRSMSDPPPIRVQDTSIEEGKAPERSASRSNEQMHTQNQDTQANTRTRPSAREKPHHRRRQSPGIEWHDLWTKDSFKDGRVLLIDYVARNHIEEGKRKIVAQEFHDLDGLRRFYRNEELSEQAALRVIHVQDATWALRYLFEKFNIDSRNDLVGTNFGRWAKYAKPQRRGGKPVLNGKTFRTQRDPWRGVSRAAFGCDYLKHYDKHKLAEGEKMMELNRYDRDDQPVYGYDVFVQRLSVYVQLDDGESGLHVDDPDIRNPYKDANYDRGQLMKKHYETAEENSKNGGYAQEKYIPKLESLDNGSTIIVFESSQSGSVEDTLIGARQEIEQRWRRLTFYLPREETESDEKLTVECMDFILRDIFKAVAFAWERYINVCETHIGILEDKIYENPADESRAPELWTNSSLWLKVERLMYLHSDIAKEMRNHLKDLASSTLPEYTKWLEQSADEVDKLITQFQEGVLKPTDHLSDLMYKSVGIRDARHSLQLDLSMWRLSWITFIFLPLTFMCGFFGMNVDTFEDNPSIKWFFISTAPLFVAMILGWFFIKHALAAQRQDPLRRGVYESLYHSLATEHPQLWSRRGPRHEVVPVGLWAGIKWNLLLMWFNPEKTLARAANTEPGDDELSAWSRIKRRLAKRWLKGLTVIPASPPQAELIAGADDEFATPMTMADAESMPANRVRDKRGLFGRLRSSSPSGLGRLDRPSPDLTDGRPGSGVMVEEKGVSEDERSGGEEDERVKNQTGAQAGLRVPYRSTTS
ncbi:hypothetical protein DM02DRAFT_391316 [Periconia macrospinosa]|uniref:Cora-domain-containing protein n=1 Tax=Periconia macrospinosa TaxID=97972 RepID=A0A2V1DTF3_9PLEO|nr:hypothetical protein DM02DRAFT_391316 [Periconia macrospinosa]